MSFYTANPTQIFDYKSKLTDKPKTYKQKEISTEISGRFDLTISNVIFECFLKPSEYKNLFVFFSAAGRNNGNTIFNRISWCNKLNGLCLYIEDPMYKKHPGLSAGWYFGTSTQSYLELAIELVKDFAEINNIKNENIFFTGSSSAGYAALYCANKIQKSNAYAYNPQIYLNRAPEYPNFKKLTQLDLDILVDEHDRANIDYVSNNKLSNFFIFYNQAGPYDSIHFESWLKDLNIKSEPELKIHNNTHFLIQNIKNSNPHSCIGEIEDFIHCITSLKLEKSYRYDLLNSSINRLKNYTIILEDKFYQQLWFNFTNNELPENIEISKSFVSTYRYIDFKVLSNPKLFVYRVSYTRLKARGEYVLYIRKNISNKIDEKHNKILEICNKLGLKVSNQEKHFRIHSNFKGSADIFNQMLAFIKLTLIHFEKLL